MAKLSTYERDTSISNEDLLTGSNFVGLNTYNTKNFKLADLVDFFNNELTIDASNVALKANGGIVKETISGTDKLAVDLGASSITGQLANSDLANSSITINGSAISLGGSVTTPNTQNITTLSFVDSSNDILLRNTTSGAGSGSQDIKFVAGTNITLTHTDANNITITATDTDTNTFRTVTAGGNTLGASETLAFTAGTNISISESNGAVTINSTDTNTQNTTTLSFVDSSNDIILRNTTGGAGSGTDDIKFVAGSNITLTHTDADNITISSADTNTNQLTTFTVRDDDDDDITIAQGKFLKFVSATGTAGTNVTGAGTTGDPFIVTITSPNDTIANTFRTVKVDTNNDGTANETIGASEELQFLGGTNITLAESGGVVTINSAAATTVGKTSGSQRSGEIELIAGTNVSITEDSTTGHFTFASTDTNTQLSQEEVEDFIGGMLDGTETGISVSYDDTDGNIDFVVSDTTVAGDTGSTGITPGDTLTIAGGTNVTTAMSGDTLTITSTDTNTQLSTEQVQDIVGAMFSSNTETRISATYEDSDGTIDLVVDDMTANTQLTTEEVQDIVGGMVSSNTETGITVTYEDSDGTLDFVVGTLNQDTTGTAAKVTVTDSTANTNFPVVFHDESNALLDDTGALRYNPSTGTLLVPNLNVAGTTTQVDTVTMEAQNAIIFEGATSDAHETTLTITDPTADRTITLPNATGTVALTSQLVDTNDDVSNANLLTRLAALESSGGTADETITIGTDSGDTIAFTGSITVGGTAITGSGSGGNSGNLTIAGGITQSFQGSGGTTTFNSYTNTSTASGTTDASQLKITQKDTSGNNIEYTQGVIANGNAFFGSKDHTGSITGIGLNIATGNTTFSGTVTANSGISVDNITIDGTEIDLSSGDLTLDVAGDIILDSGGGDISLKDDGTHYGSITNSSTDLVISSIVADKDILFKGLDSSSNITALTLDMSDAGKALFNSGASFGGIISATTIVLGAVTIDGNEIDSTGSLTIDVSGDLTLDAGGADIKFSDDGTHFGSIINESSDLVLKSIVADKDIIFKGIDDSSTIAALTLDMSENGNATFSGKLNVQGSPPITANSNFNDLVITDSAHAGISIFSGNSSDGAIYFGDTDNNDRGQIKYSHSSNAMSFLTNDSTALTIDSSGNSTFEGSVFAGRTNDIGGYAADDFDLMISNGNTDATELMLYNDAGNYHGAMIQYYNNVMKIGFSSSNTQSTISNALELAAATGNATFAGTVSGTSFFGTGGSGAKGYDFTASGSGAGVANMFCPAGFTLGFGTNNTERMRIDSSGNVGIGVTPVAPLQVKSTSNINFTVSHSGSNLRLSAVNDDSSAAVPMDFNGSTYGFISGGATTFSGAVLISHGSGDTLTLTKSTTEPSMRFEGDTDKDFCLTISGETFTVTQNDGTTDILTLDHDTKKATFAGDVQIDGTLSGAGSFVPVGGGTFTGAVNILPSSLGGSTAMSDGTLIFGAGSTNYYSFRLDSNADLHLDKVFGGSNSTVLTVDRSSGNVGIGNDNPTKLFSVVGADGRNSTTYLAEFVNNDNTSDQGHGLYVQGGTNSNHHLFQVNAGASTTAFAIKGDGNVGIGTSLPAQDLHIKGDGDAAVIFLERINSNAGYLLLNGSINPQIAFPNDQDLRFATVSNSAFDNLSEKMRITSAGAVGIGATAPTGTRSKLSVNFGVTGSAANLSESVTYATMELYPYRPDSTYGMFFGNKGATAGYIQTVNNVGNASGDILLNPFGGNIGIGTANETPRADSNTVGLQIGNTSSAASQLVLEDNDSNGPWRIFCNQSLIFLDDSEERMRITSGGNVLIGGTTDKKQLTVYGGNDDGIWVDSQGAQYTSVAWGNNGTEKANIAWDNTNTNFAITAYGGSSSMTIATGGSTTLTLDSSSNATFAGTGTFTSASSYVLTAKSTDTDAADIFRVVADDDGLVASVSKDASDNGEFYLWSGAQAANIQLYGGTGNATFAGNVALGGGALQTYHSNVTSVLALDDQTSLFTRSDQLFLANNFFYNASDAGTAIETGGGSLLQLGRGALKLFFASSVTGGTTASLSQKFEIDSSGNATFAGNVTISKSAPTLELSSTSGSSAILTIGRTADTSAQIKAGDSLAGDLTFSTGGSRRIQIANGGDITFNNDSTFSGKVTVGASLTGQLGVRGTTNDSSAFSFEAANSSGNSLFIVRNDGVVCINQTAGNSDADGFVVFPTGSSGGTMTNCYNGDDGTALRIGRNSDGTLVEFVRGTSTVGSVSVTSSGTSLNTSSDYRIKEDLKDFNGLDKISKINMYDFKYKNTNDRGYGVIAHELQEVYPQAVHGEKDADEMQGVDYSKIVPLLVKSIQELEARIKELENN